MIFFVFSSIAEINDSLKVFKAQFIGEKMIQQVEENERLKPKERKIIKLSSNTFTRIKFLWRNASWKIYVIWKHVFWSPLGKVLDSWALKVLLEVVAKEACILSFLDCNWILGIFLRSKYMCIPTDCSVHLMNWFLSLWVCLISIHWQ